ncbi:retrovirus-related pol polyprotein from transposon tnt 1-94 [Cucumis melo var. makuwa]|uniref:Retrovirus-related pol polyprotein from transposon tnt 1-94 n=1 Tax=Cucumis melo var. makuwa TaxID=1194695 RepID=A0A5D3D7N2_CUCMM|nr:retrovirus-related pol polyprotein from transposon tnt 1-94 [Cucumis melo var. makuwa]
MEAEYVAACEAAKEVVWLKKFLTDLEIVPNMHLSITLRCDNSSAVANSREPRSHKRGKHIERKYHLIGEIVHQGDVTVTKISFEQNLADPFTKALTNKVFESHLHGWIYIITQQTLCPTRNTYWQSITELQQTKAVCEAPKTQSLPGKCVKHFGKDTPSTTNVYKLYDVVEPAQHSHRLCHSGARPTLTTTSLSRSSLNVNNII